MPPAQWATLVGLTWLALAVAACGMTPATAPSAATLTPPAVSAASTDPPLPPAAVATVQPVPAISVPGLSVTPVALPDGQAGIGFDDLVFDAGLNRLIVPAGRTGRLDLIDPVTLAITAIGGFSAQAQYDGGHGAGTTSADAGSGMLFAVDRSTVKLVVIDPVKQAIVGSAMLGGSPDYVRFVAPTREVWVTEPDAERIEVFALPAASNAAPSRVASITVSGGPESLAVDPSRKLAYTHLWAGRTAAIDLQSRTVRAVWVNGCADSRGVALDESRGFLFAACAEGKVVVLDAAHNGAQLGSLRFGSAIDVIGYNPALAHLYLPASASGSLGIAGVAADGSLSLLGTAEIPRGAHCAAADNHGQAWACDPAHGQILRIKDTLPASGR